MPSNLHHRLAVSRLGGWIPHDGDERPVPPSTLIRVMLAGGIKSHTLKAEQINWSSDSMMPVVSYQVIKDD